MLPSDQSFDFFAQTGCFGAGFGGMLWNSQTLITRASFPQTSQLPSKISVPALRTAIKKQRREAYPYEYVLQYYAAFL